MITVIIAGGSGTRLWPLSTPGYPKHLLKINGDSKSLLQRAYDRAKHLSDEVHIITEVSHAHHVQEQLPQVPKDHFVIEPARRNTSGCVLAALRHVQKRYDPDEPLAILWSDHYIRDVKGFTRSFQSAADASVRHNRVVLVGIEPTYPSTGFGYIKKNEFVDDEPFVYEVAEFKEKPSFNDAQEYIRSGNYLWNGGYLVGTLNAFVKAMKTYCPQMLASYQSLISARTDQEYEERYLQLESIAIDYTFSEKVKNLLVVHASFDWLDLGSFKDIYEVVKRDSQGNHIHGKNVELEGIENALIQNYEDKPIAVIGLDNIVIVNTPHGLLVARKDLAQQVGEVSKRFSKKS